MATNDDNTTDLTEEEVQPFDADLPVDADAEAASSPTEKGFDRKKIAGLGIVAGLVIVAGLIVFSMSKKPTDTGISEIPPTLSPPRSASKPGKAPASPQPSSKPPATVNPNEPVTGPLRRPGDANWVKGIKKPLPVPNGLEATPGQPGSNTPQIRVVKGTVGAESSAPANSKDAALKRLWKSGAAAKHRGDYAAARKDWQRILELDPGHAGIQDAINKLPQ